MERVYPDVTPLLEAKAERRRKLAALSWEDKVAIIERMRALLPGNAWKDRAVHHVVDSSSGSATQKRQSAEMQGKASSRS